MKSSHCIRPSGFTLVELLVAIALLAILLAAAIPSFASFQRTAALSGAASSFLSAIHTARSESINRSRNTILVPAGGSNWGTGWSMYVDLDSSGGHSNDDLLVHTGSAFPPFLQLTGSGSATGATPYVLIDAQGYPKVSGAGFQSVAFTLSLRSSAGDASADDETRMLILSVTGRARVCRPSHDASCQSGANN